MPEIEGPLVPCKNGYHVCEIENFLDWASDLAYIAEIDGNVVYGGNKVVSSKVRLLSKTGWNAVAARMFAAECAEHVLPIFETRCPLDYRPRQAIQTARWFAVGKTTRFDLDIAWQAIWSAVTDAPDGAEKNVARAAAGAVEDNPVRGAATAAAYAFVGAQEAATSDGLWSPDSALARQVEIAWQMRRLKHYLKGGA